MCVYDDLWMIKKFTENKMFRIVKILLNKCIARMYDFSDFARRIFRRDRKCLRTVRAHLRCTQIYPYTAPGNAWNGTSPNTTKIAIIADVRRRQITDTKAKLQFLLQLRSKTWFVSAELCACEHRIHSLRVLDGGIQSVISDKLYGISSWLTIIIDYFRLHDRKCN